MTEINPFKGLRYNLVKSGQPQQLFAPARAFLSAEERALFKAKSPFNASHLFPFASEEQKALADWLEEQAVREDEEAILYLYEQNYQRDKERLTCHNLVAALCPGRAGSPAQSLMRKLPWGCPDAGKLWPVRLLYDDPDHEVDALMRSAKSPFPDTVVHDDFGVEHRLFRLQSKEVNHNICKWFLNKELQMVDAPTSNKAILPLADHQQAHILVSLTNAQATGLSVQPTHQLLSGISSFKFSKLVKHLGQSSTVHSMTSLRDMGGTLERLQELGESGIAFALIGGGGVGRRSGHLFHLSDRDIAALEAEIIDKDNIRPFSTQLVEHMVYTKGLSKDLQILRDRGQITSVNDPEEAMKISRSKDVQMLLLHTAPTLKLLRQREEQIPHCAPLSFYVFPPLISGLVFRSESE